jgi:hypothetical protein
MPHVRSRILAVGEDVIVQFPGEELPIAGVLLDWDEWGLIVGGEFYAHLIPWNQIRQVTAAPPRALPPSVETTT